MPTVSTPFGELSVIVNPGAGGRRVGQEIPELERVLRDRGLPYRLHRTEKPGDATAFTRRALTSGNRFVVAVGGDGTVHEVVNGMFENDRTLIPDPVLGVVAAGSGNDLVRSFGIPGDVTRACARLTGSNIYSMDIGKITCTRPGGGEAVLYFPNIAEAGLGGAVAARAERLSGRSRYFLAFWLTLPRFRLANVTVHADRQTYEGPAYNIVVANCQYYGGGMKVSPKSYPGDGVFEILVMKGPKSDSFTTLPRVYRGDHIPHPHIAEMRARTSVRIDADRPLPIEADGEPIGSTPATIEILPQAVQMKI